MIGKPFSLVILLLAVTMIVSGCGESSPTAPSPTPCPNCPNVEGTWVGTATRVSCEYGDMDIPTHIPCNPERTTVNIKFILKKEGRSLFLTDGGGFLGFLVSWRTFDITNYGVDASGTFNFETIGAESVTLGRCLNCNPPRPRQEKFSFSTRRDGTGMISGSSMS